MTDDEDNQLVHVVPASLLERVAEDPNAGAIVALGMAGIAAVERSLAADRLERQHEREDEQRAKQLEAEERQRERQAAAEERQRERQERKEIQEREAREKEATRAHDLELWSRKHRFLLIFAALCCFLLVVAGIYLLEKNAVLAATIITAAGLALVTMAKDAMKAVGVGQTTEDAEKKSLPSGDLGDHRK